MGNQLAVLDARMLQLSPVDYEDVRTACSHKLILGTTGSGKSSTSYKSAVISALKLGAGGFFCIAKPEDADAIRAYCAEAGRLASLIDWNGRNFGFNVLAYELARTGNLNDVLDMLLAMFEIVRGSGTDPGKAGDQFWKDSAQSMLAASVPIVYGATGTVRVGDLLAFIRSAPSSSDQMRDSNWQSQSNFARMFDAAAQRLAEGPVPGFDTATGQRAMDYWTEFSGLDPKTQGNIRVSVTTLLSRFESGILKESLCSNIHLFPAEQMMLGAIVLMNVPVQVYGEDGAILQKIVKHAIYRTILTRNAMPDAMRCRPILIGADECQNFLFRDAEFLAQCRSSLTMVVMATQSLPTLYAKIGGDHPHDRAHYFASAFNTVVLHSSACGETNEWFAKQARPHPPSAAKLQPRRKRRPKHFGMNMGEEHQLRKLISVGRQFQPFQAQGSSYGRVIPWDKFELWQLVTAPATIRAARVAVTTAGTAAQSWAEQSDWVIEPGFFARELADGGHSEPRPGHARSCSAPGPVLRRPTATYLLIEMQQS